MTQSPSKFKNIKNDILEKLGPILEKEEEKKAYSEGFNANLDYFKLDFLEPNEVALGLQLDAILPVLWAMAGSRGEIPTIVEKAPYLIGDRFAVLLKEQKFAEFNSKIKDLSDLTYVFIVTNSEDAFFEMKAAMAVPNVIMLYKNYLRNFELKRQWKE